MPARRKPDGSHPFGIDMEFTPEAIRSTRADVNYDSLTGTFLIPDRRDLWGEPSRFAFALDEKGIVFIDREGLAGRITEAVGESRRWRMPSLERFIYDFLEKIIEKDQPRLEQIELQLERMEDRILNDDAEAAMPELNDIRNREYFRTFSLVRIFCRKIADGSDEDNALEAIDKYLTAQA